MTTPLRFIQGPLVDVKTGYMTLETQQWLQNPEFSTITVDTPIPVASGGTGQNTDLLTSLTMAGPVYFATPTGPTTGTAQTVGAWWSCTGVPDNAGGQNGDFCSRTDGTVGSNIYKKVGGVWTAIL